jgi:hypothetical protein
VLGNNDLEINGLTNAFDKIGGQLKMNLVRWSRMI